MPPARKPYRWRRLGSTCARPLGSILLILAVRLMGQSPSGISIEGPFTVFRTGTNEPLLTLSLPFSTPSTNAPSLLRFEIGFATAEPDAPDTFFDSFSVTLQNTNPSATALLLTADRTGVQWAPSNPGGLTLDPASVQHADASFPDLNPALALKFAWSVTFALPALLTGSPLTLFFDLFDNLNTAASLAYVQGVRLETAVPGVKLHSATLVDGPYAEETGALLNETNRIFTLNKPTGNRFFRVLTDKPTRIVSIGAVGPQLLIEYQFETIGQLAVLTAGAPSGPFAVATNAVWNPTNQTLTLPRPARDWYFRLVGDRQTKITGIRVVGDQVVLDYRLVQLRLRSAPAVPGPYTEEFNAVLDETNRTFTVSQPGGNRFYRVFSDVPVRSKAPRKVGNQLVLEYEFNP